MPDHQQHIEHKKYAFKLNKCQRSVTMSLQLRYTKSFVSQNKHILQNLITLLLYGFVFVFFLFLF